MGIERLDVLDPLPKPNELDRDIDLAIDCDHHSALRRTVELGQDMRESAEILAPRQHTFASLCIRDMRAVNSSWQGAARTPDTRLAAIPIPIPVPQIRTPRASGSSTT